MTNIELVKTMFKASPKIKSLAVIGFTRMWDNELLHYLVKQSNDKQLQEVKDLYASYDSILPPIEFPFLEEKVVFLFNSGIYLEHDLERKFLPFANGIIISLDGNAFATNSLGEIPQTTKPLSYLTQLCYSYDVPIVCAVNTDLPVLEFKKFKELLAIPPKIKFVTYSPQEPESISRILKTLLNI